MGKAKLKKNNNSFFEWITKNNELLGGLQFL